MNGQRDVRCLRVVPQALHAAEELLRLAGPGKELAERIPLNTVDGLYHGTLARQLDRPRRGDRLEDQPGLAVESGGGPKERGSTGCLPVDKGSEERRGGKEG